MAERTIRLFGDPVLITRAQDVVGLADDTAEAQQERSVMKVLINDMFDTMDAADGVGLAANQVGVLKRVFVYDCRDSDAPDTSSDGSNKRGYVINPVWTPLGDAKDSDLEGCLSIPGIRAHVERFSEVVVHGSDLEGSPLTISASGLLARCIQHETDHLDGVLFIKRLTSDERKKAMKELREMEWFGV